MDCHIVSDDVFFLQGAEASLRFPHGEIRLINAAAYEDELYPLPGDIMVLFISSIRLRRQILQRSCTRECRLMIILKPQGVTPGASRRDFPWLLPWDIRPDALSLCIRRAATWSVRLQVVSSREWLLFNYFDEGLSVSAICDRMGLKAKYIYAMKQRGQMRFGLQKCNAADIILCRDIMALNPPPETNTVRLQILDSRRAYRRISVH